MQFDYNKYGRNNEKQEKVNLPPHYGSGVFIKWRQW